MKFITGPHRSRPSCPRSNLNLFSLSLFRSCSRSVVKWAQSQKGGNKTSLGVSMLFNCTTWKSASGFQFRLKLHKISSSIPFQPHLNTKLFCLFVLLPINLTRKREREREHNTKNLHNKKPFSRAFVSAQAKQIKTPKIWLLFPCAAFGSFYSSLKRESCSVRKYLHNWLWIIGLLLSATRDVVLQHIQQILT